MTRRKKHYIGTGLFLLLLIFFYTYSIVVFSFSNESSPLFEGVFVSVYLCFLIALSVFYIKNDLISEHIALAIFAFVFADPNVLGLVYYPIYIFFESTDTMQIIDNFFAVFTYPFDIFCSDAMFLVLFFPIIPLISVIIHFIKRNKKEENIGENTKNTGDGSLC